jgi:hypothetical protein
MHNTHTQPWTVSCYIHDMNSASNLSHTTSKVRTVAMFVSVDVQRRLHALFLLIFIICLTTKLHIPNCKVYQWQFVSQNNPYCRHLPFTLTKIWKLSNINFWGNHPIWDPSLSSTVKTWIVLSECDDFTPRYAIMCPLLNNAHQVIATTSFQTKLTKPN